MKQYAATARRDGKWWLVEVPDVDGAFTQVRRLDQAGAMAREVVSLLLEIPESEVAVAVVPQLDGEAEALLRELAEARDEVARAERHSQAATRQMARALTGQYGLSLRDAGIVMGVSFQRVAQLVNVRDR